jgi:hypothetical protein
MNTRWVVWVTTILIGCSRPSPILLDDEPPAPIETGFDRLSLAIAGIENATEVILYEGLPDNFWQPAVRERELRNRKTIKLHGYPFYEETLPLQGTDSRQLTTWFSTVGSYSRYQGVKPGGGYHPDYCIEWKTPDGISRGLISLESSEVKIYGRCELHCDLSAETSGRLKQVLSQYQRNRPNKE